MGLARAVARRALGGGVVSSVWEFSGVTIARVGVSARALGGSVLTRTSEVGWTRAAREAREGAVSALATRARTFASSATDVADDVRGEVSSDRRSKPNAREGTSRSQGSYMLFHPQYDLRQVENVKPAHRKPKFATDYLAYGTVQLTRWAFDMITGYSPKKSLSTDQWLTRFIFLETVAGVPGMVGAMLRHMMSLRTLKRDHGWIHTLLEEAENERMHLLTFLKLREPGLVFRLAVLAAQGIFFNGFFLAYVISPRVCHRFVGYLEEEAVRTYTHALHDIDGDGQASEWARLPAPKLAVKYWRMPEDATVRDLIIAVRADEASHSHVNHTLSSMGIRQANPFHVGHTELPENFVDPPAGFVPEHCR